MLINKILSLSQILLRVVQFQLLVAVTILDVFEFWNMCCSCIPYPCRTTFPVNRFLLLCQISIFIFWYPHLFFICCSFVFLIAFLFLAYFLLLFFWSFLSFSLYFSMLFILHFFLQKSFLIVPVVFFSSSTNYIRLYAFFMFANISFPSSLFHSVVLLKGNLWLEIFCNLQCQTHQITYKTSRVFCHIDLSMLGNALYFRLHSFAYATYVGLTKPTWVIWKIWSF